MMDQPWEWAPGKSLKSVSSEGQAHSHALNGSSAPRLEMAHCSHWPQGAISPGKVFLLMAPWVLNVNVCLFPRYPMHVGAVNFTTSLTLIVKGCILYYTGEARVVRFICFVL